MINIYLGSIEVSAVLGTNIGDYPNTCYCDDLLDTGIYKDFVDQLINFD